ncbi:hypothetical protein OIPHN260_01200 [Enterobacter roggenkampii]|uniref:Uncharacterized protein n=1 Tax=Enterobacter roggenkampii TaxID=1812935 RepID=A0AAU9C7I3_9ENTR|nr:hypothetical protein OIPHN260_01200 [Enterobacter roggenkampii]
MSAATGINKIIASTFLNILLFIHFNASNISAKTSARLITALYLACIILTPMTISREIKKVKKAVNREGVSTNFCGNSVDIMT